MSTFTQWRTALDNNDLRRITWVCGEQRVLVEEVVQGTREAVAADPVNYVSFTAGTDPDADIWAGAFQHPLTPTANRLVVVRSADKITNWRPLTTWLAGTRSLSHSYLLFVADTDDFYPPGGRRTGLPPHLEQIKKRGRMVRCAMLNETDALTWVRRHAPLPQHAARRLLQRANGDLGAAAGTLAKLNLFPAAGNADPQIIDALTEPVPAIDGTDALLAGDKPAALRAFTQLDEHDLPATLALLDSRLDTLATLWRANRAGLNIRDITGVNPYLARTYLPLARHYHPNRCLHSRWVLAVCDSAARRGIRVGVVETLVALW